MCYGIYDGVVYSRCFGDHSGNRVHIGSHHISVPERDEWEESKKEEEKRQKEKRHIHVRKGSGGSVS